MGQEISDLERKLYFLICQLKLRSSKVFRLVQLKKKDDPATRNRHAHCWWKESSFLTDSFLGITWQQR